ncbi:hypothetical protein JCM15786_14440 [Nautilia lithotrophica]
MALFILYKYTNNSVRHIIYIDLLTIKEEIIIPGINIKIKVAKNLSFSFFK